MAGLYDLAVRGGRVIDPHPGVDDVADLAIDGGKAVDVVRRLPESAARQTVEARGWS